MGDFSIPGAPFVLSLPDGWNIEQSTLSETQANCILAISPQEEVEVVYNLYPASSLDEILADTTLMYHYYSRVRFELSGMDCLVFNALIPSDIMAVALWRVSPIAGSTYGTGPIWDHTVVFIENNGITLQISIKRSMNSEEFEFPALLVLSGVAPGPPLLAPNEAPFKATSISPLAEARQKMPIPTKPIEHKGTRQTKLSDKKPNFKPLLDMLAEEKPMIWCLNMLKEISEALGRNRDYGQYSQDLMRIHAMLKAQWGLTDEIESTISSVTVKRAKPETPPASTVRAPSTPEYKHPTITCSKCGTPLQKEDKFCRECGTLRTAKPTRWSPWS